MPVIAKFYGIVVRMLAGPKAGAQFHAFYEDSELVLGVWPVRIIQGDAPRRVREMVLEWARTHEYDLLAAWNLWQSGLTPKQIEPLR
jgi:hypothetical protein